MRRCNTRLENKMQMTEEAVISLKEAAEQLGIPRSTLDYRVTKLEMEKKRFKMDREVYIKISDFEYIKRLIEQAQARKKAK